MYPESEDQEGARESSEANCEVKVCKKMHLADLVSTKIQRISHDSNLNLNIHKCTLEL